jgi:hypothetical protein
MPESKFIEGESKSFKTIPPIDYSIFEMINENVQQGPQLRRVACARMCGRQRVLAAVQATASVVRFHGFWGASHGNIQIDQAWRASLETRTKIAAERASPSAIARRVRLTEDVRQFSRGNPATRRSMMPVTLRRRWRRAAVAPNVAAPGTCDLRPDKTSLLPAGSIIGKIVHSHELLS